MIQTRTYQLPISLLIRGQSDDRLELSRLLAAAVVNQQFCHLLLEDPEQALNNGFQGESFLFTEEERDLILSIRTDSLADLANQLVRTFNEHSHIRVDQNCPVQPTDYFGY